MKIVEPMTKYDIEISEVEKECLLKAKRILLDLKNICILKDIDFINFDNDEEQISFNEDLFDDAMYLLDSVSSITSIEKEH